MFTFKYYKKPSGVESCTEMLNCSLPCQTKRKRQQNFLFTSQVPEGFWTHVNHLSASERFIGLWSGKLTCCVSNKDPQQKASTSDGKQSVWAELCHQIPAKKKVYIKVSYSSKLHPYKYYSYLPKMTNNRLNSGIIRVVLQPITCNL